MTTTVDYYQQWADALRSGQYKKTTGQLFDGCDGYCLMGVLGRLHGLYLTTGMMDLPTWLTDAVGLRNKIGSFDQSLRFTSETRSGEHYVCCLTQLNDQTNWGFLQIADFMESNREKIVNIS